MYIYPREQTPECKLCVANNIVETSSKALTQPVIYTRDSAEAHYKKEKICRYSSVDFDSLGLRIDQRKPFRLAFDTALGKTYQARLCFRHRTTKSAIEQYGWSLRGSNKTYYADECTKIEMKEDSLLQFMLDSRRYHYAFLGNSEYVIELCALYPLHVGKDSIHFGIIEYLTKTDFEHIDKILNEYNTHTCKQSSRI